MPNALQLDQVDDFCERVLQKHRRRRFVDVSLDLQEYYFADRLVNGATPRGGSRDEPIEGGKYLEWKLRVANQGNAKHSGLYAVDGINRKNVLTKGTQRWSKQTVGYTYDIDEDEFSAGPLTIIRRLDEQELGLYNDFYELMEVAAWTAPTSSTQDPRPPSGIPFWLQKSATEGFYGGDPSGFAAGAADILTATYPNWRNWTFSFRQVNRLDMVEKLIKAMDWCYFKPPRNFKQLAGGKPDYECFTTYAIVSTCRQLLQAGNDALGADVARYAGEVIVRGAPLRWVPALSNPASDAYDSTNPIYGVNWRKFKYFFKEGKRMVKQRPFRAAHQHSVRERHMDNWGNTVCYDRRGAFSGYQISG